MIKKLAILTSLFCLLSNQAFARPADLIRVADSASEAASLAREYLKDIHDENGSYIETGARWSSCGPVVVLTNYANTLRAAVSIRQTECGDFVITPTTAPERCG